MRKFLNRTCPNLGRYYFTIMLLALMLCFCSVTAFAVEDMWTVANMGPGHFTTSGHFIVLRGVTEEGQFLVTDPISYGKSQQEWDSKIVFNEARNNAAAGGPFWIIG